jgi:KaiC/GvpD/RAD55 family RecA-like ATPase
MNGEVIDRCKTGIPGFDDLCQGGLVRNSVNVITGGPGTGKTTFLLQFLWNGATSFNENGLYCSFEQDITEVAEDARAHGWDLYKLNEEEKVKFVRFSPETSIRDLTSELTKLITKHNIQRLCFDPISVLALGQKEESNIRKVIFELSSLMKRLKITTLLTDESLEPDFTTNQTRDLSKTDIIRFLCDSVIFLYDTGISGVADRSLKIKKMRRTNHLRQPVGLLILDNGLEVFNMKENSNL